MKTSLTDQIRACTLCAERFATTKTAHAPRPVPWFTPGAAPRILLAGQAPGLRVHEAGRPFHDRSGDRLRAWLGLQEVEFYDRSKVAIWPAAFCFPGYDAKGSDLPPPALCWCTWNVRVRQEIGMPRLTVLIGSYAIRRHLGTTAPLREVVARWRDHAPSTFVLPHPSWRNTGWIKKNAWFEAEVLPSLRLAVTQALA